MRTLYALIVVAWSTFALAAEPVKSVKSIAVPLQLEIVSVRAARTSEPASLIAGAPTTAWTVVTAKANSRAQFPVGDAVKSVLFLGEVACLTVWRDLRVTCIVPRIESVGKLSLWGPVTLPISRYELPAPERQRRREQAEKEGRVFNFEKAPALPNLDAKGLDDLVEQIRGSAEI